MWLFLMVEASITIYTLIRRELRGLALLDFCETNKHVLRRDELLTKMRGFSMLEEQIQSAQTHSSPKLVFDHMIQALNRHDLDAMVACFAPDFRSEQPIHPERNFTG